MEKQTIPTLAWEAPEYEFVERDTEWFVALGIIGVSAAAAAFLLKNQIFGLLLIIATATVMLFAKRPPKKVHFQLNEQGVKMEQKTYLFSDINAYWVEAYTENAGRLLLRSANRFTPLIIIPIENISPETIANTLRTILPEEELSEPLLEKILHYLGI